MELLTKKHCLVGRWNRKLLIKEQGWAGHYCLAEKCLFRRNTVVSYGNKHLIVSTVGNCILDNKLHFIRSEEVVYETLVFNAVLNNGYWEPDSGELKSYLLKLSDYGGNNTGDILANNMHEKMIDWIKEHKESIFFRK